MTKAEIQLVRALADKRGRAEHGLFLAEGEKLIGELRASHLRVRRIYALEGIFAGEEVETVAPRDMERLSQLKTPSNSLALVEIPHYRLKTADLRGQLTLALDEVQNPGNVGTIIRLADWFGIRDILCSEGTADCFNPKVVQATMGAILRVRVHYVPLAPLGQIKGVKLCRQNRGFWREEFYRREDPRGREYFWLTGSFIDGEPEATDTDEWALRNHYVSVVPVQADLTDYRQMKNLEKVLG